MAGRPRVIFRIEHDDLNEITERALAEGQTRSDWLRAAVEARLGRPLLPERPRAHDLRAQRAAAEAA